MSLQKNSNLNRAKINEQPFSYPVPTQIVISIICLVLNTIVVYLAQTQNNPLFLDTVFTTTAAFFGWTSGLIVGVLSNIVLWLFLQFDEGSIWFTLCSLSITVIVRVIIRNKSKISGLDLLAIYLFSVLVISFEGAIIFSILYQLCDFVETTGVRHFTILLLHQQIPLIFSAFLARIPINLLDKALSTFGGWLLYVGIKKFIFAAKLLRISN